MDEVERQHVIGIIEDEGFEYAFVDYTDFEFVSDEKFHQLRAAYLDARNALVDYLDFEGLR